MDNQNQVPICQLFRHVVGTVQTVPFTFCIIAALVAVTVCIVVFAVLIIQGVALSFLSLAIKAIIQTPWTVALAVTLPVIEVTPALQRRRAVLPRIVKIKRAVSSIPAAGVVVAQRVADVVPCPFVTLRNLAAHLHFRRWSDVSAKTSCKGVIEDVAQQAVEIARAAALEERHVLGDLACATVVAGIGDAEAVGGSLALRPSEGRRTQATWAQMS